MLNLALISGRTTGAVVRFHDVFISIDEARQILNRPPDIAEGGIISWGNIEMHEIERLMMHGEDPDPEGLAEASALNTQYAEAEYFWSLFFNEKEYG